MKLHKATSLFADVRPSAGGGLSSRPSQHGRGLPVKGPLTGRRLRKRMPHPVIMPVLVAAPTDDQCVPRGQLMQVFKLGRVLGIVVVLFLIAAILG